MLMDKLFCADSKEDGCSLNTKTTGQETSHSPGENEQRELRVLICFSNTGGGHRSAARALTNALAERLSYRTNLKVKITSKEVIDPSSSINHILVSTYNLLLRYRQDLMKHYFNLIEWMKPNQSALGYVYSGHFVKELLTEEAPDLVVSVHPMANHYLARALKDLGLSPRVKLIVVVTDPNGHTWKGWACTDADMTIAPNDLSRDALLGFGLSSERILTIGMPVDLAFAKPPTKSPAAIRSQLGLAPDKVTVCLTGGSAGGGNLLQIYDALELVDKDLQVIFLCGRNPKLESAIRDKSETSRLTTLVLPYAESLSDIMIASDLLVTKPGGLTSFEAVARRLPMALDATTESMPQEEQTIPLLVNAGLAQVIQKPSDIIRMVEDLEPASDRFDKPLPKEHNLDRIRASEEIADVLLAYLEGREPTM